MPKAKHESPGDQPSQVDRFRDLARELECDEDEKAFEDKVRKIAAAVRQMPEPDLTDPENPEWTAEDFARAKRERAANATTTAREKPRRPS